MHPFLTHLKELLSHNRTAVVLDVLPGLFQQRGDLFNQATMLRARYSKVREDQLGNLISEDDAYVEYTRINQSILAMLEGGKDVSFDENAARKLLNELLAEDEKWRVREGFLDRIKQSQSEAMARSNDAVVPVKVNSKVFTWLFMVIFLIFVVAFLIIAIKSPPGSFKASEPKEQTTQPAKEKPETEKPAAPIPSKNVPPPLRKQ